MKRLIALLVGLTVLLSMSLTSFAAFTDAIELNTDGVTYTAALSDEAATTNAGKQTTIVAYKGDTIEVGSIQYIDQAAATSFTFQLKDELTEDVKVVMGGEAIDKQEVGTIFFGTQEDPTYTISGIINDESLAEMDFDALLEELDEETVNYFKEAWGTKVILVADDEEHADLASYLLAYLGDEEAVKPEGIATATVDVATGAYAFENVAAGNYALIVERAGALPLFTYVTVEDANVTVATKTLIMGDIAADISVDGGDVDIILENSNKGYFEEDPEYNTAYDIAPDWILDGGDIDVLLTNANATIGDYSEAAIDDILALFE